MSDMIKIALFDFDGTIIPSQSGHKFALNLFKTGKLSKKSVVKLLFWGFRYKTHLPYKENLPRELIFGSLIEESAEDVDKIIDKFYEDNLDSTVRAPLMDMANQIREEGVELVVLSAAFTQTLKSFAKRHNFLHIVGTDMQIEDGKYTGKVDGDCVAGEKKFERFEKFADETFGEGKWVIEYAFADHYTDRDLLVRANKVYAVNPDQLLKRAAKKNGWNILKFNKKEEK